MNESHPAERQRFLGETAVLISQGRLEEALEMAGNRRTRCPGDIDASMVAADCALRMGRFDEARAILQELDRLLPSRSAILEMIGDACRSSGAVSAALDAYRAAIAPPDDGLAERIGAKIEALLPVAGPDRQVSPVMSVIAELSRWLSRLEERNVPERPVAGERGGRSSGGSDSNQC